MGQVEYHLAPAHLIGSTWIPLETFMAQPTYLGPLGSHLGPAHLLGSTWVPLGPGPLTLGPLGSHLGPAHLLGSTWVPLGPGPLTWVHLGPISVFTKIISSKKHEILTKHVPYPLCIKSARAHNCVHIQLAFASTHISLKRLPGIVFRGF